MHPTIICFSKFSYLSLSFFRAHSADWLVWLWSSRLYLSALPSQGSTETCWTCSWMRTQFLFCFCLNLRNLRYCRSLVQFSVKWGFSLSQTFCPCQKTGFLLIFMIDLESMHQDLDFSTCSDLDHQIFCFRQATNARSAQDYYYSCSHGNWMFFLNRAKAT